MTPSSLSQPILMKKTAALLSLLALIVSADYYGVDNSKMLKQESSNKNVCLGKLRGLTHSLGPLGNLARPAGAVQDRTGRS